MTAGVYCIKNISNDRVYVGSSRNIERRFQSHFEDLQLGVHHSWKLQEDWNKFNRNKFSTKIIHSFENDNNFLELLLEIYERYEVITNNAVSKGYNVSDEIIRDTSLVLKYCDEALDNYIRVNRNSFENDNIKTRNPKWTLFSLKSWPKYMSNTKLENETLDVERHAYDYLQKRLISLFMESGLEEKPSTLLADSYSVDVKKMRGGLFRYWGRDG
jgi:group I intron endonuclease